MRIVLMCLVAAAVSVAFPAAAEEAEPTSAPASGNGAAVAPSTAHTLAQVHGGLTADAARVAGRQRDIEMSAAKPAAGLKVVRPAPSPRVLRRMAPERVVTVIDPEVRACASESTTVAPTAFSLRVSVAPGGEVEGVELASTNRVAPALLACVVKAVGPSRFGAPGAAGASIVLPITVPGRVVAAVPPPGETVTVTVKPLEQPPAKSDEVVASKP